MKSLPCGTKPFAVFSAAEALFYLRSILHHLNIERPDAYRTHDFRRGHARDMQERGATLYEILKAGEWRSPAFMSYLDLEELHSAAVVEAHLDEDAPDDDE